MAGSPGPGTRGRIFREVCSWSARCCGGPAGITLPRRVSSPQRGGSGATELPSRDATAPVLHQRHVGRVLRPPGDPCGRRPAPSRGRDPRTGRCPALRPGDLRADGVSVAAAGAGGSRPDWMEPFGRRSTRRRSTSCRAPWSRSTGTRSSCAGTWARPWQRLKQEPGNGLYVGGVQLPLALAELGLIDEYEFVVHPRLAGHGPDAVRGADGAGRPEARRPDGARLGGSGDAVRAQEVAREGRRS